MRHNRSMWPTSWLCVALAGCAGCGGDADRLSRAYQEGQAKLNVATAGVRVKLSRGWHSFSGHPPAPDHLQEEVVLRLRLDSGMAGANIAVHSDDAVITLRGEALNVAQQKRALDLAQSTVGVERVVDELKVDR